MLYTYFHWGVQAWAIVVGLARLFCETNHALSTYGPIGKTSNFRGAGNHVRVAILGVTQVNAGLNYLFDIPVSAGVQIALIAGITGMATVSVVAGLNNGIRRISELNMILALILISFVVVAGPTASLLAGFVRDLGNYVSHFVQLTLNVYADEPEDWLGDWTLFYRRWWLIPTNRRHVCSLPGRELSRGRTIVRSAVTTKLPTALFVFLEHL